MRERQVFDEFVDDYFAECDEHLSAIRGLLLALETRPMPVLEATELNDLDRRLHTLKGLSGMVGLLPAEEIAHALEDVVRASVAPRTPMTGGIVDCLFSGVGLLDRVIQAKRAGGIPPDNGEFLERARRESGTPEPSRATPWATAVISPDSPQARPDSDAERYRFEFTPSADQAARGVGVEAIRQRLQALGAVVRTSPRARGDGSVSFEFVVAVSPGVRPPPEWRADGLTWEVQHAAMAPITSISAEPEPVPGASVVRVELSRVNDLMRMIGEMVLLRSRLDDALRRANGARELADLRETNVAFERQLRALREGVMRIRLVPIGDVFDRMRFALRDVLRQSGKQVRLEFAGGDTQIDKLIVDRMLEPLLHLVRNSASHGIEDRATRAARGKPAEGRVTLAAQAAGDRILLEVEDDGAGIDVARVVARAREAGLRGDGVPGSEELLDIICAPGFSTRDSADLTSGRGVGMSVVRSTIRSLGGELSMSTTPGQSTRFTIELPLTLMIAEALLVDVGGQVMAVPQLAMREILELNPGSVTTLENGEVISYRGSVLPLITLHHIFDLASPADRRAHVLVVGSDAQLTGLVVDRLIGLREIVVHPVTDPLLAVPGISGATELADGRIGLIIDVAALVKRARDATVRARRSAMSESRPARSTT